MLKVKNLSTSFGKKVVHNSISLEIEKGEIYGILGGSGSGKTTLVRQMIMLDPIQKGSIEIFGKDISSLNYEGRNILKKNWGVLFQFGALFSSLNVLENIALPLKENSKLPQGLIEDIAFTKLKMVGLDADVGLLSPEELSGGMKKRVAIARSLALDPEILFLDEPTSGLDPVSAKAFDHLILDLRDMLGLTVVVVTHELNTIQTALDKFCIIHNGKLLMDGSYNDALNQKNDIIDKFLKIKR